MYKNKGDLGEEIIKKILLFYENLNPEWLLLGEGEMLKASEVSVNKNGDNSMHLLNSVDTGEVQSGTDEFATVKQRFEYLIKHFANGNKRAFANMVKIPATVVENVVGSRGTNPSFAVLQNILYAFEYINPKWLITGKGDIFMQNKYAVLPQIVDMNEQKMFRRLEEKNSEIKELFKQIGRLEAENSYLQQENEQLKNCASRSVGNSAVEK
jgi:hypothetical protein